MLTNVYGPQSDQEKLIFLDEIRQLKTINELPWIILGDFNITLSHDDTTTHNPNLGIMLQFNNLIHDINLFDISLIGRTYT